ncbi:MAG: putative Ig domain-containing protein [Nitrospirae bacterium]|nr:putative Ig domain-containing protein [Nitrospirota bacterium]
MKILNVFPPSAFIVSASEETLLQATSLDFIQLISSKEVIPSAVTHGESSVYDAIRVWNKSLTQPAEPVVSDERPFEDDVIIPTDLPKTKEEKERKEKEYRDRWKIKKEELEKQEREKKAKRQNRSGTTSDIGSGIIAYAPGSGGGSAGASSFGAGYGAGLYDTSLYMAGDIAVGFFFVPGTSGNWTTEEINTFFDSKTTALNQFIADEPNANITFTFVKELGSLPSDERAYVNDLRNANHTHWAYMIMARHDCQRANANLWGPTVYMCIGDDDTTLRHETMHIFGVQDQYCPDQCISPIGRWGYLNAVNANSQGNDGMGYFLGAGEGKPDIMINNISIFGAFTRGQVGWRDADGDGILDPLDTYPDTSILTKTGSEVLTYTGTAIDQVLFNEKYYSTFGDVTLNTITSVEYRINGGAWVRATPSDGVFDSGEEQFTFTTPSLSNDTYTIEIRATNSVGNTEISFAKDTAVITSSAVTNVVPSAAFNVSPSEGSIATTFTFDASQSSDIEDVPTQIEVRWDFENDGTWDTSFSPIKTVSQSYLYSGTKTARLEIKDSAGSISTITKQVNVSAMNLSPKALFTASSENQHGFYIDFPVTMDASGSWDGEDAANNLQVRWDFEDDGTWDTPYSYDKTAATDYQFPQSLLFIGGIGAQGGWQNNLDTEDILVSGNYAYVARQLKGIEIIDVSNPYSPVIVTTYNTPGEALKSFVSGNYLYVADGSAGLQIIDITNPINPLFKGSLDTQGSAKGIFVAGNYAFIADGSYGLQIFNISDPANPSFAGSFDTPGDAYDVYVSGNYAYVADGTSGLQIINVAMPETPGPATNYDADSYELRNIYVTGNYVYLGDGGSGMKIINIENPTTPVLTGTYNSFDVSEIYVSGNYAYVATAATVNGWREIHIVDISNPVTPSFAGRYSFGYFHNITGIYMSGNNLFISDQMNGLQIADASQPFNFVPEYTSLKKRIRLEVKDGNDNTSQATRDVWAVTYNNPPVINNITIENVPEISLVGEFATADSFFEVDVIDSHAYIATSAGLKIADITNPASPVSAGNYNTPGSAQGVYVSGNNAYIAGSLYGLYIIDISNPNDPSLRGYYDTPGIARDVYVQGNYAYIADYGSLQIINITDPGNPIFTGSYADDGNASGIFVSGSYAYLASSSYGLLVIDVSNPTSPQFAANRNIGPQASGIYISGNYAYITDAAGLKIFDVTYPANPVLIGSYNTSSTAYQVYVSGSYAYLTDSTGVTLIDISNPSNPAFRNRYNLTTQGRGIDLSSGYVYVSNGVEGLKIFNLQNINTFIASTVAIDPDIATTWDGLLEYRWDIDNDGVWDTSFSSNPEIDLGVITDPVTVVCEAKDRFHATDIMSVVYDPCTDNDNDNDTYSTSGGNCGPVDCNDSDASINPGAADANCNGIDENCSGAADEGYTPTETSCGIGACAATGQNVCQSGVIVDTCAPGTPGTEICNSIDDNCNGETDEICVIITTPSLPAGTRGAAYSQTLTASNGQPPYTWSIVSGSLPPGVSLSSTTGVISGTPTTSNTYSFTVHVLETNGTTATRDFSIGIYEPLDIITIFPPSGVIGTAYDYTLWAGGGLAPYTWSVLSGDLPPGLSMDSSGRITGTPTTVGAYYFTARITDINNNSTAELITLGTYDPIIITTPNLSQGTQGVYYSQALTATGGRTPYTWSIASGSQPLPPGLSLNSSTGEISGIPTQTGTFGFTVRVWGSLTTTKYFSVGIFIPCPDSDGDGYGSDGGNPNCPNGTAQDCNDSNALINPGSADNNCNAVDENCSGSADEGYVPTATSCGVGVCATSGENVCQGGVIVNTCTPGSPTGTDDNCNAMDENCNGTADENYVPTTTSCGLGVCMAAGQNICQSGTIIDTCAPGLPSTEVCDGEDNDCNGVIDDATNVVTPLAGSNGSISPDLPQNISCGNSISFTITPDDGYSVADVLVDGVSAGAVTGYTFSSVTADHNISASFVINRVQPLDVWTDIYSASPNNTSATNLNVGSFTVGGGTNRLLLVSVVMEIGTAANPTISAAYGGTALTQIGITANTQREIVWMGYLKDSQIGSGSGTLTITYSGATGNASALHVKWASYIGVNQTSPVNSSAARNAASTSVTFGSAINFVNNGLTVVVSGNGGAPATGTLTATPAFTAGTAATTNAQTSRTFTTATHTANGSYTSSTTVSWSGTTSSRSGLVVVSLWPDSPNQPPVFTVNPVTKPDATVNVAYSGQTLSGSATDPEGDAITYSKVSGPAWLTVAPDGTMGGTPTVIANDSFVVRATAGGGTAEATLNIAVASASAGVAQLNAWTNMYSGAPNATSRTNLNVGSFTVSSGTNRLLLVSIVMEVGTASNPAISAAYGGTALTQIGITANTQREIVWMGYLKDAQIGSGSKTLTITFSGASGNATGLHVKWASFTGVNQTSPIAGSSARSAGSTSVTFNATINYVNNGMTTVAAGNGGSSAAGSLSATPAFTAGTATTTNGHTSRTFTTARHTANGSYAGSTAVSWSGTTSNWSGLVVVSFQP